MGSGSRRLRGSRWDVVVLNGERGVLVCIFGVLDLFVEVEAQTVPAFVADGQIGKDEITSLGWAVEVGDAGNRHTGQRRARWRLALDSSVSHGTSGREGGIEEEIGIVAEGDISLVAIVGIGLQDA